MVTVTVIIVLKTREQMVNYLKRFPKLYVLDCPKRPKITPST